MIWKWLIGPVWWHFRRKLRMYLMFGVGAVIGYMLCYVTVKKESVGITDSICASMPSICEHINGDWIVRQLLY